MTESPEERNIPAVKAPEPYAEHADHEHGLQWMAAGIGFVALAAAAVWFRLWEPFTRTWWGTLVVDSIGVAMAAFGYLNPLLVFIHVTSELAFILNSTRLLPRTSETGR